MFHKKQFRTGTVSRGTCTFDEKQGMPRRKWSAQTDITPTLLKSREKRKWQIALRRYILERNPCNAYAPYFGLDIENLRKWLECQFTADMDWAGFGSKWQFEYIIPIAYFDFNQDLDFKLCWNFVNIRVVSIEKDEGPALKPDLLIARKYFESLFTTTRYPICEALLLKVDQILAHQQLETNPQQAFIQENRAYLDIINTYSNFEFELLNKGRNPDEVKKELDFLKKYE